MKNFKNRWIAFWGLVFFVGICINFLEIICRMVFHFSIDLMFDLPVWLTIWAVMMVAGPIYTEGDHVSVDMLRDGLKGPGRKICDIISGLASIAFGAVVAISGYIFIAQCFEFNMQIVRCVPVPRWAVEICIAIGMTIFTIFAIIGLAKTVMTKYSADSSGSESRPA